VRKSKLDHPHIKQEVVKRLAVGEKPKSIAEDVGLHHSQVYRFASREDIKALIEQEQMKRLEGMPDAVENMMSLVEGMEKAKDKDERRLCYEAIREVLKVAGILVTPTQSAFVQQGYKQQKNLVLPHFLQEMLDAHNKALLWNKEDKGGEKDKDGNRNG